MPITPADDFPLHQATAPIAQPEDGDPNRYDRYFFHGYDATLKAIFVFTMGVYPNREIIDASFCWSSDGVQHSVFASGRAPTDRRITEVGPMRLEVVEPLRELRVRVDAPDHGLAAMLTFRARTEPVEEPRQTMRDRNRVILDGLRFTQFGRWDGTVTVGDADHAITDFAGTRDRSWGIRPLPGQTDQAPAFVLPEIFWWWAPLQLDDECVHMAVQENSQGVRAVDAHLFLPDLTSGTEPEHCAAATYEVDWLPRSRRARKAAITMHRQPNVDGPTTVRLDLTPVAKVFMRGAGYTHPEYAHGAWHGEDWTASEVLVHDELEPTDFSTLHVHQVVDVAASDGRTGQGVLEQLCIGEHAPTGLTGFADLAG